MYMKLHDHGKTFTLALCDKELIGKVFTKGELVLDLKDYASFYKGAEVGEQEASESMKSASSLNLVGKRSVAIAIKLGLAGEGDVRKIGGVPHVQIYRVGP